MERNSEQTTSLTAEVLRAPPPIIFPHLHFVRQQQPQHNSSTSQEASRADDQSGCIIDTFDVRDYVFSDEEDEAIDSDGSYDDNDDDVEYVELRLNIDGLSYEELCELEESMGNVNVGLTEEELFNCIKKHIHKPSDGDEACCVICQEVYEGGEEVGELACKHIFHMSCIQPWLQLKKWCPSCKTSVSQS